MSVVFLWGPSVHSLTCWYIRKRQVPVGCVRRICTLNLGLICYQGFIGTDPCLKRAVRSHNCGPPLSPHHHAAPPK